MMEKEIKMAKTHLLQAVCAVAMLAAVPALAQPQQPVSGMDNANGTPNPAAQRPASNNNSSAMTPADNAGSAGGSSSSASSTPAETHATHRSAMAHHTGMTGRRSDTSQDAAVDQLNEQSYAAAQKGQPYGSNDSNSAAMPPASPAGAPSGAAPVGSGSDGAGSGGNSAK
jgi:hypothetical protein